MRILIVHSQYRSGPVSGENRIVGDETELLRGAGHDVTLWAPIAETHGLDLVKTGVGAVWSRSASQHVKELIERSKPDVMHCHNLFPTLSPAVIRAARNKGIPVVMTLHNYRLMCLPGVFLRDGKPCELCLGRVPWRGVKYRCHNGSVASSASYATSLTLHRRLHTFEDVQLYLASSGFVRDKHIQGGLDGERIVVKPNFTPPMPPRTSDGDYFLFLGRLSEEKGAAELVRAWRNIDAPLLVVGDGPDGDQIAADAPPNVEFRPPVQYEDVPGLLKKAIALCVPSLSYEGCPRGILEAYAAGVPVIAHRVGAIPEFVNQTVGVLVAPGDDAGWARAVEHVADPGTNAAMGAAYAKAISRPI
jgi:glycosyltransferase involved in cell wall biosynthesis